MRIITKEFKASRVPRFNISLVHASVSIGMVSIFQDQDFNTSIVHEPDIYVFKRSIIPNFMRVQCPLVKGFDTE